jgi:formylglycine-generating enzyme required for sulfatase activity
MPTADVRAAATRPGTARPVPGFEIHGELGRGAMGIVYRARQLSLNREVAIKVLPPILANDPHLLGRFRNEAALAAGLVESHVLPVYDVQEVDGVPVLVMPLIAGGDLGRLVRDRKAVRDGTASDKAPAWARVDDRTYLSHVLPLLDQLVAAVAALHRAGVLHRDLKPSNALFDGKGGLWLSDFGLARLEEHGVGTRPGVVLGTPGYMSPEQAAGQGEVDRRADVFGLGATLYQALTLELPYGRTGPRAGAAPPVPPSHRQPLLPGAFDTVLLKALELDPARRYASASLFREDWRRVRAGEAPHVRPAGRGRTLARAARRHPRTALACAAIVPLLAVVTVLALRHPATPEPPPSANPPPDGRTVLVTTQPPGARVAVVPIDPLKGVPLADRAVRPEGNTPLTLEGLAPGDYLVVAEVAGYNFHEVYRLVPRPDQVLDSVCLHRYWDNRHDGSVAWPTIQIPPSSAIKGMVFFNGGQFTMGMKGLDFAVPHPRRLADYYLDATEVTVGEYRGVKHALPQALAGHPPPDDYAVSGVPFDHAMDYAEKAGKRLPDEAEYEYAATNRGRTKYPWGDDAKRLTPWRFGPVRKPRWDHTDTTPPVFGLYSNVAEWTQSWPTPYPGSNPRMVEGYYSPEMQLRFWPTRVVRGGPPSVVEGRPEAQPDGSEWDPRFRFGWMRDEGKPGLGFRCARSALPRFLKP